MGEQQIGVVTHYFGKVGVAAIQLVEGELRVGDTIHVKGHTSDFTQKVESMQVEHQAVDSVRKGEAVGLRVSEQAREHDLVYKVTPD
jgi:putative protease